MAVVPPFEANSHDAHTSVFQIEIVNIVVNYLVGDGGGMINRPVISFVRSFVKSLLVVF